MNGARLFDNPADAATPITSPAIMAIAICFRVTAINALRLAPSAVLTASSRERCDTECDSTPNRPAPAIISAKAAKPRNNTAYNRGRDNAVPIR